MRYDAETMRNASLVTHLNCCDGAACAICFVLAGGNIKNVHYVAAGHGVDKLFKKKFSELAKSSIVFIADVSPREEDVETISLMEKAGNIIIIDHHKTAAYLSCKEWCTISMDKCASSLLCDHFKLELDYLNNFLVAVNDHDMWINAQKFSDSLALYMTFVGQKVFVERSLADLMYKYEFEFSDSENFLLASLRANRQNYINSHSNPLIIIKDNLRYGYVFIDEHENVILNKLLIDNKCDVAVAVMLGKKKVSIRTVDAADASEVALTWGGGGHARSAGHTVDGNILKDIIKAIHP